MASKRLTRSSSTLVSILAFIALLAAINFYFSNHFARKDLTANKMFTTSSATKSILSKMNDDVTITVYSSENLPPDIQSSFRSTKEFLQEFQSLSNGKIRLRFETPKDDKSTEEALQRNGIQKLRVNVLQKDELQTKAVYCHILLQHRDKTRVFPFPRLESMEYDIASALLEVTQREKSIVAFVINDPDFRFDGTLYNLRERLGMDQRFDVREINLKNDQELTIPKDCKTLIVVKPKNFKDIELYRLDQFVMNGGALVAFVEAVDFSNPMNVYQQSPPPNIIPLLEKYGVKVNSDLVSDYKYCANRQIPAGRSGIFTVMTNVRYPQWVITTNKTFDKDNPALSSLQALLFPQPNSLEFASTLPEGVKKIEMIKTSDQSARQDKPPFNLQPPDSDNFKEPEQKQSFLVAAGVTGPLVSYYKDREIPKKDESKDKKDKDDSLGDPPKETDDSGEKIDQAKDARVFVISAAQMLNFDLLRQNDPQIATQTLIFVQNLVDWLTLGNDLISIRTKPIQMYRLRESLKDEEKASAKFFGRFAMPLVVAVVGIVWWWLRRMRMKTLSQEYRPS